MLTDTGSRAASKRKRSKMTAESAAEFRDRKRPDVMSTGGGGGKPPTAHLCAGCSTAITDRFLLKAVNKFWHEDCLKCGACDCRLGEVGSTLYEKANLILCRRDYLRLFGSTGHCAACSKLIPAFEMVMRAKDHVYHLECFACQQCNHRFCVGDRFYLCEGKILCEYDYEERRVFASLPYTPGSLDHIKRPTVSSSISSSSSLSISSSSLSISSSRRSVSSSSSSGLADAPLLAEPCPRPCTVP